MSPGMKNRIRAGKYAFPSPEWDRVSEAGNYYFLLKFQYIVLSLLFYHGPMKFASLGKDLIRKLLKTDPSERFTIEQTMNHKWITHYQKVPETPLFTSSVLKEEQSQWGELQVRNDIFY